MSTHEYCDGQCDPMCQVCHRAADIAAENRQSEWEGFESTTATLCVCPYSNCTIEHHAGEVAEVILKELEK